MPTAIPSAPNLMPWPSFTNISQEFSYRSTARSPFFDDEPDSDSRPDIPLASDDKLLRYQDEFPNNDPIPEHDKILLETGNLCRGQVAMWIARQFGIPMLTSSMMVILFYGCHFVWMAQTHIALRSKECRCILVTIVETVT
jgi:hypothetical protein